MELIKKLLLLNRSDSLPIKLLNKTITSDATFTRSSLARCFVSNILTAFNANNLRIGVYEAGDNYEGFIFEGERINYVKNSTDSLGGSWGRNSALMPIVGSVATPISGITAPLYALDTTNTLHNLSPNVYGGVSSTIDYVIGTSYAFSLFVYSNNTISISKMRFESPSTSIFTGSQWGGGMYIDLATGAVVGNTTGTTATLLPNGWVHIKLVRVATGSGTQKGFPILYPNIYGNNPGDGVSGLAVTGAQAEVGSFASSYIPTNGSIATRSADITKIMNLTSKPWFNPYEGTIIIDFKRGSGVDIDTWPISLNNGSASERIDIKHYGASGSRVINGECVSANVQTGTTTRPTGNANIPVKAAFAYKQDNLALSINGSEVDTDVIASIGAATQMNIGLGFDGNTGFFGTIKSITYYPRRLPNQDLQTLTL